MAWLTVPLISLRAGHPSSDCRHESFSQRHPAIQAAVAAQLVNAAGRKRTLRVDSMIAGAAVTAGAVLATNNKKDFALFEPHGLKLV